MRIIHLSDIHLSQDNLLDFQQFYLKALIEDLIDFNIKKKIDLILITGDLIDKGGISFIKEKKDPFEEFNRLFIDPILDALSLDYNNVFIDPGNHDINESSIDELVEGGMLSNHVTIEKINFFLDKHKYKSHSGIERILPFKIYEKKLADLRTGINQEITNFESNYALKIDGLKVGLTCLNSGWRCSSKLPNDKLNIGTRQLLNANIFNQENCTELNIVLLHHPLEFISSIERTEIENLLQSLNFNIVLSGHIHSNITSHQFGPKGRIFVNVAKSAFGNPREKMEIFKPGYNLIDVLTSENTIGIQMYFRKYIHSRFKFDKDVEAAENGEYIALIPTRASSSEFSKMMALTNNTYRSKLDNINTSLLIYGTDSIAPRSLVELFVLPNLTDSVSKYGDLSKGIDKQKESDVKYYAIDELILDSHNILLIGDKESGKSTLLNQIFIEVANSFAKYYYIPVRLSFFELIRKEIKHIVKDFLNEPNSDEIEKFLLTGKILLIIDDFENSSKYIYANSKLRSFIREYAENKIIISTAMQLNELISDEEALFGQKDFDHKKSEFKPIFIGAVGVKQFQELAAKWFKRKDKDWIRENLEKLIKVFEILKTPRTFFSVSLFLWIIEKQESFRPQNKANLVFRFLLLILKGLKIEDSEAGKYTFEKKVEILREVALEMYINGESVESYSLQAEDIIACIKKNFHLNQLKLDEFEKYKEFIDKGIFKKTGANGNIAFRYEAFFQYFLSLNIDKNSRFKKHVFSDKHFISFIDELDYYTGNSRDNVATLKFAFKKLNTSYETIDAFMTENLDRYLPNSPFLINKDLDNFTLDNVKKNKFSDNQIERTLGDKLETLPVQESIRVKKSVNSQKEFYKVLELAAKVLKNSENIQNPSLINNYLDTVINRSAKYGIFMQSLLAANYEKYKDEIPLAIWILIPLSPIATQDVLLKWMGTDFLEVPLENKISRYISASKESLSEYELFITVFIYYDLRLTKYIEYLEAAIDKIDNLYIIEMIFIKVFHDYLMRSSNSSLIPKLEAIMVGLLSKLKNISKKSAKYQVENLAKKKEKNQLR